MRGPIPMLKSVLIPAALALTIVGGSSIGHAACDPASEPDASDIANARALIAANCDCSGTESRSDYKRCAKEQAEAALTNGSCASTVRKCESRSTCGKPGAVTCCTETSRGTKCKV